MTSLEPLAAQMLCGSRKSTWLSVAKYRGEIGAQRQELAVGIAVEALGSLAHGGRDRVHDGRRRGVGVLVDVEHGGHVQLRGAVRRRGPSSGRSGKVMGVSLVSRLRGSWSRAGTLAHARDGEEDQDDVQGDDEGGRSQGDGAEDTPVRVLSIRVRDPVSRTSGTSAKGIPRLRNTWLSTSAHVGLSPTRGWRAPG